MVAKGPVIPAAGLESTPRWGDPPALDRARVAHESCLEGGTGDAALCRPGKLFELEARGGRHRGDLGETRSTGSW